MTAPREHQFGQLPQAGLKQRFAASAGAGSGKSPRTRPFSIRLTDDERTALKTAAGTKPVGQFARERLLDVSEHRRASRRPHTDAALLSRVLATLGKSRLHASLSELGAAARVGALQVTPEMEAELQAACADIQDVKRLLMRGLGFVGGQSR